MTSERAANDRLVVKDEIFRIITIEANASGATNSGGKNLPKTRLTLQNGRCASIQAIDWNHVLGFKSGDVVKVNGTLGEHRGQPQIKLSNVSKVDNFDPAMLLPRYQGDCNELEARLI